jgi:16S rRNA (guanine(966)-N(2))-methyltransferase RsmD
VRIVAGEWSGRRLDAAPGTRPTAERTREALFSIWQDHIVDARFLDVFCGSGAVGLEALSRGARRAVLVDADVRALQVAARNRDRLVDGGPTGDRGDRAASGSRPLHGDSCRTYKLRLPGGLAAGELRGQTFDLVFADPPYGFEEWASLLAGLEPLLTPDGEIAIEHAPRPEPPERVGELERTRTRRYGRSALSFYRRQGSGSDCRRNDASSR